MTQIMTAELTTTVVRTFPAPPTRVYDAWLDPAFLSRFMVACDGGTVPEVSVDPRVGGHFLIVMNDGTKDIPHRGTYLDLTRPHRMVFTWTSPHSVEGSIVTLTLTAEGTGTRLELRQDKFASEGARDGHTRGWTRILQELATAF